MKILNHNIKKVKQSFIGRHIIIAILYTYYISVFLLLLNYTTMTTSLLFLIAWRRRQVNIL
jgi:hypothetical protein